MAQKPVLRGEVGCACVAREVSVGERMKRGEMYSPATSEVPFGARRRAWRGLLPGDVRSFLWRVPAGEGAEVHDLQPGEVFGVCRLGQEAWGREVCGVAKCSTARVDMGVVARCSTARVGVGEDAVATARRRGDVFPGVGEGALACSSINSGRSGALLGSSVELGSGCGQPLPGVPRKAPRLACSYGLCVKV